MCLNCVYVVHVCVSVSFIRNAYWSGDYTTEEDASPTINCPRLGTGGLLSFLHQSGSKLEHGTTGEEKMGSQRPHSTGVGVSGWSMRVPEFVMGGFAHMHTHI